MWEIYSGGCKPFGEQLRKADGNWWLVFQQIDKNRLRPKLADLQVCCLAPSSAGVSPIQSLRALYGVLGLMLCGNPAFVNECGRFQIVQRLSNY